MVILNADYETTAMERAIVQDNHHITLPEALLQRFNLQPEQALIYITKGNVISLMPIEGLAGVHCFSKNNE